MGGVWKRVSCQGNKIFYSHRRVSCRTISLPSFNVLHWKLTKIALFIYSISNELLTQIILGWVYDVISFAYFTHFSNLNISRANADICKRCDTIKKSRGKNLIMRLIPKWRRPRMVWVELHERNTRPRNTTFPMASFRDNLVSGPSFLTEDDIPGS